MQVELTVTKEFDIKTLKVEAGVRYWEDTTVNGEEDTEGLFIPCRSGSLWKPEIDVESGVIINWKEGEEADVHYKVCDSGCYHLYDDQGQCVVSLENEYVPTMLAPGGDGFGDYIIMKIDASGKIENWSPEFEEFDLASI